MGPDGIHTGVLKELYDVIVEPLFIIFQLPWDPGEVLELTTGVWEMLSQFSSKVRRNTLVITDLSVSL